METPQLLMATFGVIPELSAAQSHPNRMKFRGVLVRLDEPSTKAPNGSHGHRILVPASVARQRLSTLVGMGLNYASDLRRHNQQRKVGTITRAWIEGRDLHVEATIWKHDFPEAERDLKRPGLGMSMELGDIAVKDQHADVWVLTDFCFLGATVLERAAAAYFHTSAIAASSAGRSISMAKVVTTKTASSDPKKIAQMAAEAAVGSLRPLLERQALLLDSFATRMDAMEVSALAAGQAEGDVEADDAEACDDPEKKLAAAKKTADDEDDDFEDSDEDEDDIDSATDKGGLEDMGSGPSGGDDNDEPGDMNKGAKNKGSKTASENKVGRNVNDPITGSARLEAALKRGRQLAQENAELKASIAGFTKRFKKLESQVAAHGQQEERRSRIPAISHDLSGFLAKGGISAESLHASGQKMTTADADAVIATVENSIGQKLSIEKRIQTKNDLRAAGLMDDGVVTRQ